jgi:hypothetical protein
VIGAAAVGGVAALALAAPAHSQSASPAIVGPLGTSAAAMSGALPPVACNTVAATVASGVASQAAARQAVLPIVAQGVDQCAQAAAEASAGLTMAEAVIAPAAAVNPVLNPVLDIGAGVADAAAAQLPPQAQMFGPGPSDVAPVFTYLKGS